MSVLVLADRIVYYLYMASIVGKKRGGSTSCCFLVECRPRVNGKPGVVSGQE